MEIETLLASLAPQLDYDFELNIVQQPQRARNCGFGDKDRRPITPPIVAKLVCLDRKTRQEVPVDEIDTTFLIMAAHLQTSDFQDANVIQHGGSSHSESDHLSTSTSAHSPSASSQVSVSRPPSPSSPEMSAPPLPCERGAASYPRLPLSPAPPRRPSPSEDSPHDFVHSLPVPVSPPLTFQSPPRDSPLDLDEPHHKRRRTSSATTSPIFRSRSHSDLSSSHPLESPLVTKFIPYARETELSERAVPNLIGALHTNAFKLKDETGKQGIFFVFHDLSVRSEGAYRLRLKLMSIGNAGKRTVGGTAVVAATISESFNVTSAKRFEGMLDPTSLSKTFAKQGVRIPTRRVARAKGKAGAKNKEEES